MKKKGITVAFVAAFAMIAGYSIQTNRIEADLSCLALDNVEALADGEINPQCPHGCVTGSTGCYCWGQHDDLSTYKGKH